MKPNPPDRSKYIRVTQALKIIRTGYDDYEQAVGKKKADFVLAEKSMIGIQVHDLCRIYNQSRIEGKDFDILKVAKEGFLLISVDTFRKYQDWVENHIEEIRFSEQKVFNDRYQYQGTLDLVCRFKGDKALTLIDIKTTAIITPIVGLQLSAYLKAFEEGYPEEKIKRRIALRIHESENPKAKEFTNHEKDFNLFLYALSLTKELGNGKYEHQESN